MDPKSVWTVVPMYALRSWKMFSSLGPCFLFLTAFPLTYLYASHSLNTPVGTSFLVLKFCLISVIGWIVYWLFLLSGKTFVGCPWIVGSFTWCVFKNNSCFRHHWMACVGLPQVFPNNVRHFRNFFSHNHTIGSLFCCL